MSCIPHRYMDVYVYMYIFIYAHHTHKLQFSHLVRLIWQGGCPKNNVRFPSVFVTWCIPTFHWFISFLDYYYLEY